MKKNVFVVIVTFNGDKWIEGTIQSLLKSNYTCKIVVVDNGSSDNTIDIIGGFKDIKLIGKRSNLGFGQANNIGIEYSQKNNADYIFLLNQDAIIEEDTIFNLVKVLEENDDFGVLSPLHFNSMGDKYDFNFKKYLELSTGNKNLLETKFVNAAAWMIRSDVFLKYGAFSKEFFHYGEDRNFCDRLNYFKVKIGISKKSKIFHDREEVINYNKNIILCRSMLKCSVLNINKNIFSSYFFSLTQVFGLPKYYFKKRNNMSDFVFTFLNLLGFYIKLLLLLPKIITERKEMKIVKNTD